MEPRLKAWDQKMCYSLYSPCKTPSPKSITLRRGAERAAWKEREEKEERGTCGHSFRNDIKRTPQCVCAKNFFFFFQFQLDNGKRPFSRLITLITHSTKTHKYVLSQGKVGDCVSFVYWHNWDVNPNSRLRLNLSTATKVFQQSWCPVFIRNRRKQTNKGKF